MNILTNHKSTAQLFGTSPLLTSPTNEIITLSKGYIPQLVNFTTEDKAAKGLRKRNAEDKPEPPVYFSALEVVRDNKVVLLSGLSGSGKTTFAKHLALSLASGSSIEAQPLFRNEEGAVLHEEWEDASFWPCYLTVDGPESLKSFIKNDFTEIAASFKNGGDAQKPNLLIILDTIEKASDQGPIILTEILALVKERENIKLLLLGNTNTVKNWVLSDVVRHDLLPLLQVQRRQAVSKYTNIPPSEVEIGIGTAAAHPVYFALALASKNGGQTAEKVLDAWLDVVSPEKEASDKLAVQAYDHLSQNSQLIQAARPMLYSCGAVQQLLAARYLVNFEPNKAITLFHQNPRDSESTLRSLLVRLGSTGKFDDLIQGLIRGSGTNAQLGALLVSDFIPPSSQLARQISNQMLAIIEGATLPALERDKAGRILSRLGDTRDLTALANVPGGNFILGSEDHPNSQPVETISLKGFRIGMYPVVNRDFAMFVEETGRKWQSPDGFDPEKQNAPATDLSWHDAVAYCAWLTGRWQSSGKIGHEEHVRLPTEPEWERAARGDQKHDDIHSDKAIYPWGIEWEDDAANYEESGFNARCTVGLFPRGRSPYGCYDMAGQIWEWCTTRWGDDMTTPSFKYPWRNDGRENLKAAESIRRVLRGGCFSSGRLKISCTYRGSLEPAGFWRGNGFRIVVAPI